CARHLAWGFVDFPPVTPAIAFLDQLLFPGSLEGLRLAPATAGAAIVLLAGLIARELGGGARAQGLAALAALLSPMFLGANLLFQTVTFDELAWALVLYLLARLLRTGDLRLWPLLGVVFGVGLETKYQVLMLGAGVAVGLVLTRQRRELLTPWPWLGLAVAVAAVTGLERQWVRRAALAAAVAGTLVVLPLGLPVLPPGTMASLGLWKARMDYADMFGWQAMAGQVAEVYAALPSDQRASA